MEKEIKVRVPATVANLVSGFDVLGMAICEPFDEIFLRKCTTPGIKITHTDNFGLPTEANQNVAGVSLMAMTKAIGNMQGGWEIEIHKHIKPGSGLGSSAASAAGTVFAANSLLGNPFTLQQLVPFAMEGEKLASGAAHADNIAPCLFGGVTLIRPDGNAEIIQLTSPDIFVVVLHPQIELKTADARNVLPKEISIKDAVRQFGNVGALVAGICTNSPALMAKGMIDLVAEPYRKKFIPLFDEMKHAALSAGAIGGGISGSGRSVFMICENRQVAVTVEIAMHKKFESSKIPFHTYLTRIQTNGIEIF